MTLRRRITLLMLLSAPLVWLGGLLFGLVQARHEIDELFDTALVQLAGQVQATLPLASIRAIQSPPAARAARGEADLAELAIAVWNRQGQLLLVDREGTQLPYRPVASGFEDLVLGPHTWRVYYLPARSGEWLIAVGQMAQERQHVVWGLVASQALPWLLTLPVLLLVMAGAVGRALRPLRSLTAEIDRRALDELQPLSPDGVPSDLLPLVQAMNHLLARIGHAMERERRFIADAAHELRTPLAALQAQWEAAQLAGPPSDPSAGEKIGQGLARMGRLITQLLALSRLEQVVPPSGPLPIDWHAVVAQVLSELLPLADRRQVELACEWPPRGRAPLPLRGNAPLVAAMLRNLVENALRHSPPHGQVCLRFDSEALEVVDEGPGVPPDQVARLGERFYRAPNAEAGGSGLGLSIVRRIAELHGLQVGWANRRDRSGFVVRLEPAPV